MKKSITHKNADGKQYHLGIDHLNANILTGGSPGRMRKVADFLDDAEIFQGERGHTVVHGKYKDIPVSAFATGMGPASVGIVLPEAYEIADSPTTILRLGTAGGMQNFTKIGDIAISTGAIRDEMATWSVVGPEFPATADPQLIPCMVAAAEKHGYELGKNLWMGPTLTKDGIYFYGAPKFSPLKESMTEKVESYRKMGAIASAMEFSVYCIYRDYYENMVDRGKIFTGCLLAILSRRNENLEYERGGDKDQMEKDLTKIGLDTLLIANKLRKGEALKVDLLAVLKKMMNLPPNNELNKRVLPLSK